MKKRFLIMLILAIILIICIGAGLAFAYFFTDTFKSNKTLFFKYISQNTEIVDFIKDDDIKAYSEKQKQNPYTSEGTIKSNVTFPDSSQAQLANVLQNCNITFNGKVDKSNKYFNETIKVNYSDNQSIEFNLYRNNDIFALKIGEVLYKYVGFENNNLKEFATKMQLPEEIVSEIPNKLDMNQILGYLNVFTEEDISNLKQKYLKVITDKLSDSMFSKEKSSEETIYSLTLTQSQLTDIIVNLLETLKEDEIIISSIKEKLVNSYNLTEETINPYIDEYKTQIQNIIDSLNSASTENNKESNLIIKVHSQKHKLIKTEFILSNIGSLIISKSDDGVKVQIMQNENEFASAYIQKIKSPNETKFELVFSLNNIQVFDLTVEYSGLDTNSVHENSELSFDIDLGNSTISNAKTKFVTNYQNTKTFGTIQKEEIQNSEILLLNTAPSIENIQSLYNQVESKFIELNNNKLQAIGLTNNQNPFVFYIPSIIPISSTYLLNIIN